MTQPKIIKNINRKSFSQDKNPLIELKFPSSKTFQIRPKTSIGTDKKENFEAMSAAEKTPHNNEITTFLVKNTNTIVRSEGTIDKNPESNVVFRKTIKSQYKFESIVQIFIIHIIN